MIWYFLIWNRYFIANLHQCKIAWTQWTMAARVNTRAEPVLSAPQRAC